MNPSQTESSTSLRDSLHSFQARFNASSMVKKVIKNWDRNVVIEATDTGAWFTLIISALVLQEVREGEHPHPEFPIHLQASEETAALIFSGGYNPSHALIDGTLAVFSNEKDKVKLEAIAMVIWGVL